MRASTRRLLVVLIVALHTLLVLAFTAPRTGVPSRLHALAQRYVRPLFHQQWLLFAPDPPLCRCLVQVASASEEWRPMVPSDAHFLKRRMARPLADHVQQQVLAGDTVLLPVLSTTLRNMVHESPGESPDMHYRLVEQCIPDVDKPSERVERFTLLTLSQP